MMSQVARAQMRLGGAERRAEMKPIVKGFVDCKTSDQTAEKDGRRDRAKQCDGEEQAYRDR